MTSSAWRANGKINPAITFHLYRRAASRSCRHGVHLPFSSTSPVATTVATASAVSAVPADSVDSVALNGPTAPAVSASISALGTAAVAEDDDDDVNVIGSCSGVIASYTSAVKGGDGGDDRDGNLCSGVGSDFATVAGAEGTAPLFRIDIRPNWKEMS